jgi:hypothetical protein
MRGWRPRHSWGVPAYTKAMRSSPPTRREDRRG